MRTAPFTLLAGLGFTGLGLMMTACAPTTTTPQSQIISSVRVDGRLLNVSLVNAGPNDLLLKNDCPRPFRLTVQDTASTPGQPELTLTPYDLCAAADLPPQPWRVGESLTTSLEFPLTTGTRTFKADATVNVKVAAGRADYAPVRVNIAPFTVTIQ